MILVGVLRGKWPDVGNWIHATSAQIVRISAFTHQQAFLHFGQVYDAAVARLNSSGVIFSAPGSSLSRARMPGQAVLVQH